MNNESKPGLTSYLSFRAKLDTIFRAKKRLGVELDSSEISKLLDLSMGDLISILTSYCRFIEAASAPVGSSLKHENGFVKISLYKDPVTQAQVRLHVWNEPQAENDAGIHNHRWNLWSKVFRGTITVQNFMESLNFPAYDKYHLYDLVAGDRKRATYISDVGLVVVTSYVLESESKHFANQQQVHRAFASNPGLTVTLAITSPPMSPFSTVYKPQICTDSFEGSSRVNLKPVQIHAYIRDLIAKLGVG